MAAALEIAAEDDDYNDECGFLRRKRSVWVKPWLTRKSLGRQNQLYQELLASDLEEYKRLLRLSCEQFDQLLALIQPWIGRQDTVMRSSVPAKTRLQVTLQFLALGESQFSLSRQFRLGHSTVNQIITETYTAIYENFKKFLRTLKTEEQWRPIIKEFDERWQFPNCCGAIEGKHVCITKPNKSGSIYFNYKKTFSIILLAVVDANYKFLYIDVGAPGSQRDGGVWQTTPLQQAIEKKKAGIPTSVQVGAPPGMSMPVVLVGDNAFPLSENLMKPYAGHPQPLNRRIFNYRLSRARRVVENAFGILANRFRFLHTCIDAHPEKVATFVAAACVLHNFLGTDFSVYAGEQSNQVPQDTFFPVQPVRGSRLKVAASTLRDHLCDYFNGDGSVPWQADKAFADVSKYQQAATH